MSQITNTRVAYGKSQPLIDIFNQPVVALRDPNTNDKGSIGQLWTNKTLNTVWMLTSFLGGNAIWTELDNAGAFADIVWTTEAGAAIDMTNYHGYIVLNATPVLRLPEVSPVGSIMAVIGRNGPWSISQRAGQVIHFGNVDTTPGVGGHLDAAHGTAQLRIITDVADTEFTVVYTNDNLNAV